jgi:hypothetical protein
MSNAGATHVQSASVALCDGPCLLALGNVYAANGIGAVLAEQGRFAEAREIFTEVPMSAASIVMSTVCLAAVDPRSWSCLSWLLGP